MASFVLTDAEFVWNAVDLSDHVKKITVHYSREEKDATGMGNAGRVRKAGLYDWSWDIEAFNDEAAANMMATLFPDLGVQRAVKTRAIKGTAISATNPQYRGNGMIFELPVLGDSVGDMATTTFTIKGSDGVALTRNAS